MFSQFFPEIKVKVKEAGLSPRPPSSPAPAGGLAAKWACLLDSCDPAQAPGQTKLNFPILFFLGGKLRREGKREKRE